MVKATISDDQLAIRPALVVPRLAIDCYGLRAAQDRSC